MDHGTVNSSSQVPCHDSPRHSRRPSPMYVKYMGPPFSGAGLRPESTGRHHWVKTKPPPPTARARGKKKKEEDSVRPALTGRGPLINTSNDWFRQSGSRLLQRPPALDPCIMTRRRSPLGKCSSRPFPFFFPPVCAPRTLPETWLSVKIPHDEARGSEGDFNLTMLSLGFPICWSEMGERGAPPAQNTTNPCCCCRLVMSVSTRSTHISPEGTSPHPR